MIFLSSVVHSQIVNLPSDRWEEIHYNGDPIQFEYVNLPGDYIINGSFNPSNWCMGYLMGTAHISITSTSLNIDKTLRIEDFSPFSIEELGDNSAKYFPLKSNSALKISYNVSADHLADASLKIMDFDFDLNDELVFRKPCGSRWGLDFLAFELFGFEKDRTGFYYNGESEFNPSEKSVSVWYSSGACLGTQEVYKTASENFKLSKLVTYLENHPETSEEGCYESIETFDAQGTQITKKLYSYDEKNEIWREEY